MLISEKEYCKTNAREIVCEEQRAKYRALNPDENTIYKYQIDGDVIPKSSSETRCDYLIENDTRNRAYFIELKGCDLSHAIEQVEATLKKFRNQITREKYTYYLRIVCHNATHSVNGTLLRRFKDRHRGKKRVIVKNDFLEENISR